MTLMGTSLAVCGAMIAVFGVFMDGDSGSGGNIPPFECKDFTDGYEIVYKMTWAQALEALQGSEFMSRFLLHLQRVPYVDCYLEMSQATPDQPFSFKVINAKGVLKAKSADRTKFDEFCNGSARVNTFKNLDGDALLVIPCDKDKDYGHLVSFTTSAPKPLQIELWREVFAVVKRDAQAAYVSTHGTGVPWLHVRIESTPKYYH
jgi:hypothetical protein